MKVLLVTNMYPTSAGSFYGIFVKEYADSLIQLGVEVDVFFTDARESRLNYLRDIPELRKKILSQSYDVIHAQHTYSVYQIYFAQLFSKRKTPLLLTLHEAEVLVPADTIDMVTDSIGKLVYSKRAKRTALNYVDYLVSVEAELPVALNYTKTFDVIPPGIDLNLFRPMDKYECRKKLLISPDCKVLFFPADPKRAAHKGYKLLEEAILYLPDDIQLMHGGNISHNEMPVYMNASDVIVQTSNFEASPMIIKEAMACCIPIVSTDVGDSKMIIGGTEGCFVCNRKPEDIADKIKKALGYLHKTTGRDRIIELGLSLEMVAKKYIKLYDLLIHNRSAYN